MKPPARVTHVLSCDAPAGTEMQAAGLVRAMPRERCRQSVIFLDDAGPVGEMVRPVADEVVHLPGRAPLIGLVRALRRVRPDVVEAYGIRASSLARVAAPLARNPPVLVGVRGRFFTNAQPGDRKWRAALMIERALAGRARGWVTNSRGTARRLVDLGFPAERIVTIANGVDLAPFGPPPPPRSGPLRIVCVARLIPIKRHDVLLDGLARFAASGRGFECTLAGEGPLAAEIAASARRLGIADRVVLAGVVGRQRLPGLLAENDVFVLCSRAEGMPGSVIEAMGASLPVIGSAVNGISEVVDPGTTGLLFPEGEPDALAAALAELDRDRVRAAELGRAGRARAERLFALPRMVEERADLYARVAAGGLP